MYGSHTIKCKYCNYKIKSLYKNRQGELVRGIEILKEHVLVNHIDKVEITIIEDELYITGETDEN